MHEERCDMAYWWPILKQTGVKVPRTELVDAGDCELFRTLDGITPNGFRNFICRLETACDKVGGFPVFLRTGHGSGKHEWDRTCYVPDQGELGRHVAALCEWSEMVDFLGLPYKTWAVREFLAAPGAFTAFRGMPVRREFRYFVEGGKVLCSHPYWPPDSINNPSRDDWQPLLADLNREGEEVEGLTHASEHVSRHFDGAWSLDWMEHQGEWYATDMAPAKRSFHWPECTRK